MLVSPVCQIKHLLTSPTRPLYSIDNHSHLPLRGKNYEYNVSRPNPGSECMRKIQSCRLLHIGLIFCNLIHLETRPKMIQHQSFHNSNDPFHPPSSFAERNVKSALLIHAYKISRNLWKYEEEPTLIPDTYIHLVRERRKAANWWLFRGTPPLSLAANYATAEIAAKENGEPQNCTKKSFLMTALTL